ncbi:MAG: lactate racemase domain-containing protein [Gemmataceae bacterium]
MKMPSLGLIKQNFSRPQIKHIPQKISEELEKLCLEKIIRPGHRVAITAGSRGISQIPTILKCVVDHLKKLSAQPFIIPAMGSHGGGQAEGQKQILESYGITEKSLEAPILSSMETVVIGETKEGFPVFLDKIASESDHIAVVARVKPHTAFHGPIESGLLKMMLIGLGKHNGAKFYHRLLIDQPYDKVVRSVASTMVSNAPISFGLGIVENGYDETADIRGVRPEDFISMDETLLKCARDLIPSLPVNKADLLIIDRIGKDISGSGMDTNVVGRKRAFRGQPPPPGMPQIRFIHVRELTPHTFGNATGIGLADFTLTSLVESMNYQTTVINCLTAGYPEGAFIPVHFQTDKEVIEAGLSIIGMKEPHQARVMRIKDTLHLDEVYISESILSSLEIGTNFSEMVSPKPIQFDSDGMLPSFNSGS